MQTYIKLIIVIICFDLLLAVEQSIYFNPISKSLKIITSSQTILTGSLANTINSAVDLSFSTHNSIHFKNEKVHLEIVKSKSSDDGQVTCQSFQWKFSENKNLIDCFNLDNSFWYGGSEMSQQQFWPINNQVINSYEPYVTGVYTSASSVLERYWLSSSGVAIIVDPTVSLFVLKNQTNLCFKSDPTVWPYSGRFLNEFKYDICHIDKSQELLGYLNKLHLFVINKYFSVPSGVPDELMFKRPIWSTWAVYKKSINYIVVTDFAKQILANNFTNSQLEIDDKWQWFYGDFNFDTSKFNNISQMIAELNDMGFRTTLWVHPFANLISENFFYQWHNLYAVCDNNRSRPLLTEWWDSIIPDSIILDTTNEHATSWFIENLINVRQISGIDSFKFDAGEVGWLPKGFVLLNATQSPNEYSAKYAQMATKMGSMIEVRVGSGTQELPIFVRMLDKDSKWGFDNGLKSVLTTALTFSILGYPFILPDMIGGNAYVIYEDLGNPVFPDAQLYIRWTQLTAFLPSMQFSIPPWHYNDANLTAICRDLVNLHENLVFPELIKFAQQAVKTGEPIIRPVWWVDNSDEFLLKIDDQFLVGNQILVAPVLTENTFKRDIYLPRGKWVDPDGVFYDGPILLSSFDAPINKIPYFLNAN